MEPKNIRTYLIGVFAAIATVIVATGCGITANKIDPNDPAAEFLGYWVSLDAMGTLEVIRDEEGLGLIPDVFAAKVIRLEQKEACLYSIESEGISTVKICPFTHENGAVEKDGSTEDIRLILETGKQKIRLQRAD